MNYTLLQPLPTQFLSSSSNVDLTTYLGAVFKITIGLGAVLAVLMIVWGGFEYVLSTVPGTKGDGKERIQNALLGLFLLLSSYLILNTINPQLVKLDPNIIPPLNISIKKDISADPYANLGQDAKTAKDQMTALDAQAKGYQQLADTSATSDEADYWTQKAQDAQNKSVMVWANTLITQDVVHQVNESDPALIKAFEDKMTATYTTSLQTLDANGDTEDKVKLVGQYNYALQTVDDQRKVAEFIAGYKPSGGQTNFGGPTFVSANTTYDAGVKLIQQLENEKTTTKNIDPTLTDTFKAETQARIDRIKQTIHYVDPATKK